MQSGKGIRILSAVLVLRAQLAQPRLSPLRDCGLRDQPAEEKLTGKIEPMGGKRVDDVSPDLLFKRIQAAGGSGRPCPGTRGTTESEAADLRPRGIRTNLPYLIAAR